MTLQSFDNASRSLLYFLIGVVTAFGYLDYRTSNAQIIAGIMILVYFARRWGLSVLEKRGRV